MNEKKFWATAKAPLPRLWIETKGNSYLVQWPNVCEIKANKGYTKIEFICEMGLFKFLCEHSMLDFFEALQAETVRKVKDDDVKIAFFRSDTINPDA